MSTRQENYGSPNLIDYDPKYPSVRWPVSARNVVTSSQPLATAAGINALRKGGNAVDAAVATAITLTVVEPTSNGIGGDAFCILHKDGQLYGLNASGRSPMGWNSARFEDHDDMPMFGWDSVTVPGAVSAWVALSEKFGELTFHELFEDAIRYAQYGFPVGPVTARAWRRSVERYSQFQDFMSHFSPAPNPGEPFSSDEMANTLRELADTKGESFYRGRLAAAIVQASNDAGGALTSSDLSNHHPEWVEPLNLDYSNVTAHELPPNGQGLAALIALGILSHFELELDSVASYHTQIEAMKIAIRAAFDHIADEKAMHISAKELLDSDVLETAAAAISSETSAILPAALPQNHGTVCLSAADEAGTMISFIQSNYMGFGSGIVVPHTGIAMQNRGHGFSLKDGHPNQVGPNKKPFHTIIPGFVTQNNEPRLAYGLMGGHMQHQGHVQLIERIFNQNQSPQTASDAPRWMVNPDFTVSVEPSMPNEIILGLRKKGHVINVVKNSAPFGGAQIILKTESGYVAGSDHRKEGQAAGF